MKQAYLVGMTGRSTGRVLELERFPSLVDAQTYADMCNRQGDGTCRYWVSLDCRPAA